MNSGVYQIKNIINNKVYIGKSHNVFKRLNKHFNDLVRNKHVNKHLQSSFNKHGQENFEYSIICSVQIEQLTLAERAAIYMFTSTNNKFGFNKTIGGEGVIPTEEIRKKMSNARIGKHLKEETKQKISLATIGKYAGEKHYLFGKHMPEDTKQKISIALTGKPKSEEHCRKLREIQLGIKSHRFGKSPWNKGIPTSEQQKLKLSNSLSGRFKWEITRPDGSIEIINNLRKFCRENNLNRGDIHRVINNKKNNCKGYIIRKIK